MKALPKTFDLLGAVHVANVLHGESKPGELTAISGTLPTLDVEYARVMNLDEKLGAWRQQAAKTAEA